MKKPVKYSLVLKSKLTHLLQENACLSFYSLPIRPQALIKKFYKEKYWIQIFQRHFETSQRHLMKSSKGNAQTLVGFVTRRYGKMDREWV